MGNCNAACKKYNTSMPSSCHLASGVSIVTFPREIHEADFSAVFWLVFICVLLSQEGAVLTKSKSSYKACKSMEAFLQHLYI